MHVVHKELSLPYSSSTKGFKVRLGLNICFARDHLWGCKSISSSSLQDYYFALRVLHTITRIPLFILAIMAWRDENFDVLGAALYQFQPEMNAGYRKSHTIPQNTTLNYFPGDLLPFPSIQEADLSTFYQCGTSSYSLGPPLSHGNKFPQFQSYVTEGLSNNEQLFNKNHHGLTEEKYEFIIIL